MTFYCTVFNVMLHLSMCERRLDERHNINFALRKRDSFLYRISSFIFNVDVKRGVGNYVNSRTPIIKITVI